MAILDRVGQMERQGLSEQEISNVLREEGIMPKAITDAFAQSKIKQSVQRENTMDEPQESYGQPVPFPNSYSPQVQDISQQGQYPPQENYSQEPYLQEPIQQEGY